jgi:hypothetical protein
MPAKAIRRKSEDDKMINDINKIEIFETQDGQINLQVRLQDDTVWLSTEQMSGLFARERSVLTKHINNVFKEAELEQNGNVQNLHIAYSDKPIKLYSLNVDPYVKTILN